MPSSLNNNTVSITAGGTTRYFHHDGTVAGFLNTGGGWDMYANNSGQIWTPNYGWLHDYFFRQVANCAAPNQAINCYGGGNILSYQTDELVDEGGQVRIRRVNTLTNCNCACK